MGPVEAYFGNSQMFVCSCLCLSIIRLPNAVTTSVLRFCNIFLSQVSVLISVLHFGVVYILSVKYQKLMFTALWNIRDKIRLIRFLRSFYQGFFVSFSCLKNIAQSSENINGMSA